MNRRGFFAGLGALVAAPALVRASSLDFVPRAPKLAASPFHPDVMQVWHDRDHFGDAVSYYSGIDWGGLDMTAVASMERKGGVLRVNFLGPLKARSTG